MKEEDLNYKIEKAIFHLEKEFQSIRTARANINMLDNIFVEAYGGKTPLNQLSNISVTDTSTLTIQVWDASLIKNIEKALLDSNLGINPLTNGSLIRLPIPKLSEERRGELTKIASQYAESSKVVIRNIRREFLDFKKNQKKNSEISEDELKKNSDVVQKITDKYIKKIDVLFETKKNDILKV